MITNVNEFSVGDQVYHFENKFSENDIRIPAKVIKVRRILGEKTYEIETENGISKLVSGSQIRKVE
ncbi:MAG: hypothetical protein BGO78_02500 [Chloroflexi bacterium 44-23]|nr:MAG: hypothetical protein BGO78_02500 [Chloroflexi bacterium 44-23]